MTIDDVDEMKRVLVILQRTERLDSGDNEERDTARPRSQLPGVSGTSVTVKNWVEDPVLFR